MAPNLDLAIALNPTPALPAPFVELGAARMKSPEYQGSDKRLREAVEKMADTRREEIEGKDLRLPRRKILQSLQAHLHGLTLFVDHPQIPMDNNGAEHAMRPSAIARKNFYGSDANLAKISVSFPRPLQNVPAISTGETATSPG